MLPPMANRFKEGSLLEQLQNHASNYQGAPGLSTPSDPPRKKWLFSAQKKKRTGFPRFWFASLNVKSASRKYTTQVHFCGEKHEMAKIAILEIADLVVLEAWDRSGMIQESILTGLECHRTIGAVQTRIPEIVNRDSQNSLYSFQLWRIGLGEVVLLTPTPFGASMPCRAGSSIFKHNQ